MEKYKGIFHYLKMINSLKISQKNGKVRATQIASVARGYGCAQLNSPSQAPRVSMIFEWIKNIVNLEMSPSNYCPK